MNTENLTAKYEAQMDELKRRLAINTSKLTEALVEQPTLFLAARELVVDCTAMKDKAKHDMEVYAARLDAKLRYEASESGAKITEIRLAAIVASDPGYIEWKKYLSVVGALVGKAQALSDSYGQRQWMLRELAQIHSPFERDRFGLAEGANR